LTASALLGQGVFFVGPINSYPFPAGACGKTGAATDTTYNGFAGVLLPNGSDAGVSVARSYPNEWVTANLSWGYIPKSGTSTDDIRWEVIIKRVNVITQLVSQAADIDNLYSLDAGTTDSMGHIFNTPAGFALHNVGAPLGEVTSIEVRRVGSDGVNDTYTGDVVITNLNVVRAT
jgi:hypothetical protein